jgi:4-amino-4-deoxy-L-arabinose transferase-like glycosyltransferase
MVAVAIAVRAGAGLMRGETAFLHDGYEFYLTIARNFLDGVGLCYSAEGGCAARMPVYPLWLAVFMSTGWLYPGVVVAQAAIGGSLTWIAWRLGRHLFDERTALIAAFATMINPYTVIHDTALQDTVLINVLMALSLLMLLRARALTSAPMWIGAGVVLSLAVLTNARIALFAPFAILWAIGAGGRDWPRRLQAAAMVAIPMVLLVGAWTVRNWQVSGAPVLTTEGGERLWFANNPRTFANFPQRSIDLTADELMEIVPADTRAMLDNFHGSEPERDALVRGWAIDYMTADPRRTVTGALRKIWVAASAQLSPARSPVVQAGYAIVFLPIHALALWTLWRSRSIEHGLSVLLLLAFAITTALFWAHTSHKSYLDAVLFVYAAAAVSSLIPARPAAGAPA